MGIAHNYLGRVYKNMERITDARHNFEEALRIFQAENMGPNQLIVIRDLGDVYIQLDQLSRAEALLTPRVNEQLGANNIIEIPHVTNTLGWLHICAGQFDKAEVVLDDALRRFGRFGDKVWQAWIHTYLRTVYFKSNRLDEAEKALKSIPDYGVWAFTEIDRLQVLGDLYIIKGQLEDAEASLDEAMTCCGYLQRSFSYQRGNILRSKGTLHVKRGHIALAIEKYQEAHAFHRKAQCVSEQATDLKQLSEACKMLGRTEEAVAAFMEAEVLMETVREARILEA